MTYHPKTPNSDGSVRVAIRYKLSLCSCADTHLWRCHSGNCGNQSFMLEDVFGDGGECQREGRVTQLVPSNAGFQLLLEGGDWINGIRNGITSLRAVTLVELKSRSDTGKANTSPQTTILPAVRVPSNCQRDFSLLAFDPDGDQVKCRYGDTSLSECNSCTPPSVASLSSSCSLSFSPTSSSNEGPYAVQLVMEDFPRQTITLTQTNGSQEVKTPNDAISKIPVQFVLWVDPMVPSCIEGLYLPRFLPPTPANGAQLYTPVDQSLEISVKAEAKISTVSKLVFSGPHNSMQTALGGGEFILKWTPSETENGESHSICFLVQADDNLFPRKYESELRCVTVTVGPDPPTTTTATTNQARQQPRRRHRREVTNSTTPSTTTTGNTTSLFPTPLNATTSTTQTSTATPSTTTTPINTTTNTTQTTTATPSTTTTPINTTTNTTQTTTATSSTTTTPINTTTNTTQTSTSSTTTTPINTTTNTTQTSTSSMTNTPINETTNTTQTSTSSMTNTPINETTNTTQTSTATPSSTTTHIVLVVRVRIKSSLPLNDDNFSFTIAQIEHALRRRVNVHFTELPFELRPYFHSINEEYFHERH